MVKIMQPDGNPNDQKVPHRPNTWFHHVGFLVVLCGGLVVGVMVCARISISVTMMSMVNRTHLYMMEHPNCTMEELELKVDREADGEFNWSNELQQTIIASYMVTYTLPQIFVGQLCLKYGFRLSASVGLFMIGLSNLLVPVLVYQDWKWLLLMRMLTGLGSASSLSATMGAFEKWLPLDHAQYGLSIMHFTINSIIFISPMLAGQVSQVHWQWGFYTVGLMSIATGIIWFVCVREEPSDCRFVSQVELNRLSQGAKTKDEKTNSDAKKLSWYFMFKIKSFYAYLISWTCFCMAEAVIFVAPIYFKKAFLLSTKDNGVYNSITQVGCLVSCLWAGPFISLLQNRFKLSLGSSRNIVTFISSSLAVSTSLYVAIYHDLQLLMLCLHRFAHLSNEMMLWACLISQYGPHGLSGPVFSTANTFAMLMQAAFCWAIGRFLDYSGESYASWSWIMSSFGALNALIFVIFTAFLRQEPVKIRELEQEKAPKEVCG